VEDITAQRQAEELLRDEGDRRLLHAETSGLKLARTGRELRELARNLFTSQEEERSRLARELHDDVSQRLAVLEMDAGELDHQIRQEPDKASAALGQLRARIAQLSKDVRGLSHRLHPSMIEDLGLASALRTLTEEFQEREHMIASFSEQDLPETIPPDVAIGLYRITQEALRNVAKHAGRTHVKVSIRGKEDALQLSIQDFGLGFEMQDKRSGLGLISMEERARQVGAAVRIDSALGEGTKIEIAVPRGEPGGRQPVTEN
jgi:two-component system CheB/CheR fusion protein